MGQRGCVAALTLEDIPGDVFGNLIHVLAQLFAKDNFDSCRNKTIYFPFPIVEIESLIVMPRIGRVQSGTGIYHVMLRGINRQDIFGIMGSLLLINF